jgi:beta-N-acetylhexosaminidase
MPLYAQAHAHALKLPYICGIQGLTLTQEEIDFFTSFPPVGFILFARNIASVMQIQALTAHLRALHQGDTPILIDEEGGTVSRLKSLPDWVELASVSTFETEASPAHACRHHYETIGKTLAHLGITVNCAPVLDVRTPTTAHYLRPRCFSDDPHSVATLGRIAIQALQAHRIIPVIKHMPGQGNPSLDSHFALPSTPFQTEILVPFQEISKTEVPSPWGMSGHFKIPELDAEQPVTFSACILETILRARIGFQGFLITDDLSMGALQEVSLKERVQRALKAGHDAVLICNEPVLAVEKAVGDLLPLSELAQHRLAASFLFP